MLKGHVCSHGQRYHFGILRPECSVELSHQGPSRRFAFPEEFSISMTSVNMTPDIFSKNTSLEHTHIIYADLQFYKLYMT